MSRSLRAFLFGFLGVGVAVALSFGAFALAGRSIGEPARVRIVTPSSDPGERPTAATSPTTDSSPSPSQNVTPSPVHSASNSEPPSSSESPDDDHGGHGESGDDHGGNSGPGGGGEFDDD